MSKFLETYGTAIFTLVLVAILIAFAGPLGMKIKNATTEKVSTTEEIGDDEIRNIKAPTEAVDKVYCIYYDDGEMTISQNEIEPEVGRTIANKGFYNKPSTCTTAMTTVRFVGAVMPKSCYQWFASCRNLTEVKNIENLYTDECTNMGYMFNNCKKLRHLDLHNFNTSKVTKMSNMFFNCKSLQDLDLSHFDTSNVENMQAMFSNCTSLTSLDVSRFNTEKVTNMITMFDGCSSLTSLDVSGFDTHNVTSMFNMFDSCSNLQKESIKISQTSYNKINTLKGKKPISTYIGKDESTFNIVNK